MKFQVTLKDPDTLEDAAKNAVREKLDEMTLTDDEKYQLEERRTEELMGFAGRWMKYGEYVTIEFDTDAETATVIKNS